jgi:hypothetical protein
LTWGELSRGVPVSNSDQDHEVRDRTVLMPEAAGGKKSQPGAVALLLAGLAHRKHRHPEMRPQTSRRKDKSTALRAIHSLITARKGSVHEKEQEPRGQ